MMINGSSLEEENKLDNETINRLISEMKQLFPKGSRKLILEVIYEAHGKYDSIVDELTRRFGPPRHYLSQTNIARHPYERSRSDVSGLSDIPWQLNRGIDLDLSRAYVVQHISRQKDSYARMQETIYTLQKDTARIQIEIHREEEELNTRSKVQKNPTERDVEKLRKEIAKLTNEVQEVHNKLDRARGDINSGSNSPQNHPTPPVAFPGPLSLPQGHHYVQSSYPSFPQSGPRFPVIHTPTNIYSATQIATPTDTEDNPVDNEPWSCPHCTYLNHPDLQKCEMCDNSRVS